MSAPDLIKHDFIDQMKAELIGWQVFYHDDTNDFIEYNLAGIQLSLLKTGIIRICQVGRLWDKTPKNGIAKHDPTLVASVRKLIFK